MANDFINPLDPDSPHPQRQPGYVEPDEYKKIREEYQDRLKAQLERRQRGIAPPAATDVCECTHKREYHDDEGCWTCSCELFKLSNRDGQVGPLIPGQRLADIKDEPLSQTPYEGGHNPSYARWFVLNDRVGRGRATDSERDEFKRLTEALDRYEVETSEEKADTNDSVESESEDS